MVPAASTRRSLPTVTLSGAAEAIYVRNVVSILRRARLNSHYPPVRQLASHIECMGPPIHGHLYGGLEVDLRSGLPTYKEWVRVKTDAEIARDALDQLQPRAELEQRARRKPDTIYGKQLIKHDYYTALLDREFTELSVMDVALRRIDPEENTGHFHILLDKLDVSGTFVRYTIDMSQQASAWNKPMVTLDEETAGHTDNFKSLIYKFTSLDAEFTFAKLVTMGGLSVERVVKGTIGPFFFSGMQAPKPLETLLAARDGFVATFSIDMAACDLAQDRDNDPMETLLAAELSDAARAEYDEARGQYGYKVFKDRKFVVSQSAADALQAYCTASGTRNIIYSLAPTVARAP